MNKLKRIIFVIGITALFGDLIFTTNAFIRAFLNNNRYTQDINYFGEGNFEIILIFILLPCGAYVVYDTMKNLIKDKTKWKVRIQ